MTYNEAMAVLAQKTAAAQFQFVVTGRFFGRKIGRQKREEYRRLAAYNYATARRMMGIEP